jgi:branched-chain amino acid aminotransferase
MSYEKITNMKEIKSWINGKYIDNSKLGISAWDAHYFFGYAVFDAFRTYNKKLHLVNEHLNRLYKSASLTGIKINYTKKEILEILYKMMTKNKEFFINDEYRFMIFATPGNFNIYNDYGKCEPNLTIQLTTTSRYAKFIYPEICKGVTSIIVGQPQIPSRFLDPKIKSCSRLHYGLADLEASTYGDRCKPILLDEHGYITESSGSNICFIKNSTLHFPNSRDILNGRTMNYLRKILDIYPSHIVNIEDGKYSPYDLIDANLIIYTSTYSGYIPSNKLIYRGKIYNLSNMPNDYYSNIMKVFSDCLGIDIIEQWRNWYNESGRN